MKFVSDLIEELKQIPGHLPVVMASDAEGNRLEYFYDIEVTRVLEWDRGQLEPEFDDDGNVKTTPPNAIILFPAG